MSLNTETVERIAELAKLRLTPEEIERYRQQLSAILDYAERLRQLDTSQIPPTATVLPLHSVFRADQARPSLERTLALQNAPQVADGSFVVPAVLDEN
ncbi:MAG TPA: Asp-tRNA(Asn)/Glu-tRNA(Gln) amidotransferase subunit GatC [Anaerolineales bacterium]|nr:Asp-tRNA(Asn)/Glu-tRNA(Gln) amidotransferase subunit GatC [Anaerolineales bacterium]